MPTNQYQSGVGGYAGTFWSSLDNDSIRVRPEIDERIRKIRPREVPFLTFLERFGPWKGSGQFMFQWMEEGDIQNTGTVTANATPSATTIYVNDATLVVPQTLVFFPRTGESGLVTARDQATNALTVTRGVGSLAKALLANDPVVFSTFAAEEGQDPPHTLMRGTDHGELYLQEVLASIGASSWEIISGRRGPDEWTRLLDQEMLRHRKLIGGALLLGQPAVIPNVNTTRPTYVCAGLRWFCLQGTRVNLLGSISYDALATGYARMLEFGQSTRRLWLCPRRQIERICALPEVRKNTERAEASTRLGFDVRTVLVPGGGTAELVHEPALDMPYLDQTILVTDLDDLVPRTHSGAPGLRTMDNIQTPGALRRQQMVSRIVGLQHNNTKGAGIFYNCG